MIRFSCFLLFFLLLSQVVVADVETEAEKKLKSSIDKVFRVMLDKEMTMDQKKSKVIEITNSVFCFPLMAKMAIGKDYWPEFNTKQRNEFKNLFTERFQSFYVDKLDLFSDEKVIFQPAIVVQKKKVTIPTILLSKGKEYSVKYNMYNTKDGWEIYDIIIEGISIIHTFWSQYNHVLESGEVEDLLTQMREMNKEIKENKENKEL